MPSPAFQFILEATCPTTGARAGRIVTPRGQIPTPIFMPVGTQGTVKAVPQQTLHSEIGGTGAPIILGNTYHLYLRPGLDVLREAGGLHGLMGWPADRHILTDSGGYQVFSLANNRKLNEEGVTFRSHIDGSAHLFTPENVVHKQRVLGSDIQMVLDECPPYPSDEAYATASMGLTHRWAARARTEFLQTEALYGTETAQFGIVQGSTYAHLRRQSVDAIAELGFEGNAIGGLSVGEPINEMYDLAHLCCELLPAHKPRYLMGVGTPQDLLNCIARGVDMFDCVLPSRNARHGKLYYPDGPRNLKSAIWAHDHQPVDAESTLSYDTHYTRAYLRHLFVADEYLAYTIATAHNLHFFLRLVQEARCRILDGTFAAWWGPAAQAVGKVSAVAAIP
jgi:queuine tRNA-ribosyltransferase